MSLLDKVMAAISFFAFAGFLAILTWFVPKPGLVAVCVICVAMCGYDFLRSTYIRRWRERADRRATGA
jgi:hypothetical protein